MGLYSAPELELLCQQVVRDNPEPAGRISTDSISLIKRTAARLPKQTLKQLELKGWRTSP